MSKKRVSVRYALNEFKIIGLALILYAMFVLFTPYLLRELFSLYNITNYKSINLEFAAKAILMILGTVIPFLIVKLASKRTLRPKQKVEASFKDIFVHAIVFFSLTSAAIFAMTAAASTFNIPGTLVSGIGISIDSKYMGDLVYVLTFIVISPILEEFAFRGVLLNTLSKYGKYFALIATSIIFALAHGSFMEFIPSFIMGILLGKISLRYKSIKPVCWIHIIFNGLLYLLFLIPEEYSLYSTIVLVLIYAIAIIFYLTKTYRHIVIKKANSSKKVMTLFFTTSSVILAIALFITHSVLTILIK